METKVHNFIIAKAKDLFEEAGRVLDRDQLLILYGPFKRNGKNTSESNLQFEKSLKYQNPSLT